MNIEKFFKKNSAEKKEEKYTSPYRRGSAAMIDIWLVLFLRVLVMQFLGMIWLNQAIVNFMQEFQNHFGTDTIKNTPEHINFIISNKIFYYALAFYAIVILVGAFYHAYLNSSSWRATLGKRLMKIMIVKEDESPISLNRGLAHYFLSVLPFAFILYLVSYQLKTGLTFFETVTASGTNLFLGIMFVAWIQVHLFTKKKTTAYDLICDTVLVNGKTGAKFPWSKH